MTTKKINQETINNHNHNEEIQSIDILEEIDKTINNNIDNINDVKVYLKALTKIIYYNEIFSNRRYFINYIVDNYNPVMKKAFSYKKKM